MWKSSLIAAALILALVPDLVRGQATTTSGPASKPLDVTYVPGESAAAIVLRPKRALATPEMVLMPVEILSAASKKSLGLDASEIEEAILFGYPQGANQPAAGVILRMAGPVKKQDLAPELRPFMAEAQYAGKTYLRGPAPIHLSICAVDDKTILAADENTLKAMLDAKTWDAGMHKLLGELEPAADAALIISIDALRPLIGLAMVSLPQPPPAYRDFLKIPNLLSAIELKTKFGAGAKTSLVLRGVDAEATQELEGLVAKGVALGREEFLKSLSQAKPDDLMAAATQQYAKRMLEKCVVWLKPLRTDDRLTLSIDHATLDAGPATAAVMAGLMLPAVQSARSAAVRARSTNNLKQLLLAMHLYADQRGEFPARASYDKQGKPLLSWRVHLLPFVEQEALYKQFRLDEPWDSEHNKKLIPLMPAVFQPQPRTDGKTVYQVVVGKGTMFEGTKGPRLAEVLDGLSNTIAIVETAEDRAVEWTRPVDFTFDAEKPMAGLIGTLPGFNVAFADGAVRFLSSAIDPQKLRALFTAKGGEAILLDD